MKTPLFQLVIFLSFFPAFFSYLVIMFEKSFDAENSLTGSNDFFFALPSSYDKVVQEMNE